MTLVAIRIIPTDEHQKALWNMAGNNVARQLAALKQMSILPDYRESTCLFIKNYIRDQVSELGIARGKFDISVDIPPDESWTAIEITALMSISDATLFTFAHSEDYGLEIIHPADDPVSTAEWMATRYASLQAKGGE